MAFKFTIGTTDEYGTMLTKGLINPASATGSGLSKKEKRKAKKTNTCKGNFCKRPDIPTTTTTTDTPREKKQNIIYAKTNIEKEITPAKMIQNVGIGEKYRGHTDSKGFAVGTSPTSLPGQSKKEYLAATKGKGDQAAAARAYDKFYQSPEEKIISKSRTYTKKDKEGDTKRSITQTFAGAKSGKSTGKYTDLIVTKKKKLGKGLKTKSYTTKAVTSPFVSNVKEVSEDRLGRITKREKRKIGFRKNPDKWKIKLDKPKSPSKLYM